MSYETFIFCGSVWIYSCGRTAPLYERHIQGACVWIFLFVWLQCVFSWWKWENRCREVYILFLNSQTSRFSPENIPMLHIYHWTAKLCTIHFVHCLLYFSQFHPQFSCTKAPQDNAPPLIIFSFSFHTHTAQHSASMFSEGNSYFWQIGIFMHLLSIVYWSCQLECSTATARQLWLFTPRPPILFTWNNAHKDSTAKTEQTQTQPLAKTAFWDTSLLLLIISCFYLYYCMITFFIIWIQVIHNFMNEEQSGLFSCTVDSVMFGRFHPLVSDSIKRIIHPSHDRDGVTNINQSLQSEWIPDKSLGEALDLSNSVITNTVTYLCQIIREQHKYCLSEARERQKEKVIV